MNIVLNEQNNNISPNNQDNRKQKNNNNKNKKIKRPLTLQSLLTLISGSSTFRELVILSTTNLEKLDKALVRLGRLRLLIFYYQRYEDVVSMLSELYNKNHIISKLNTYLIDNKKISGATLNYIMSCTNNLDDAINMIRDETK